jgi:hypothetical protein
VDCKDLGPGCRGQARTLPRLASRRSRRLPTSSLPRNRSARIAGLRCGHRVHRPRPWGIPHPVTGDAHQGALLRIWPGRFGSWCLGASARPGVAVALELVKWRARPPSWLPPEDSFDIEPSTASKFRPAGPVHALPPTKEPSTSDRDLDEAPPGCSAVVVEFRWFGQRCASLMWSPGRGSPGRGRRGRPVERRSPIRCRTSRRP